MTQDETGKPDVPAGGAADAPEVAPGSSPFTRHRFNVEREEADLFAFARQDRAAPATPAATAAAPHPGHVQPRSINTGLAVALVALVALAPIPLGSNRPVFWLIASGAVYAIAALYLLVLARQHLRLRVSFWQVPVIGIAALAFVGYAVVQTVPFPGLPLALPGEVRAESFGLQTISLHRDATLIAALRWSSYAVFFFLMLQVADNRTRARRVGWALFLVVAAHAAWALFSFRFLGDSVFWGPKTEYLGVVTGTFVNRNSFATFAGMGAILGFSLFLHRALRDRDHLARLAGLLSLDGFAVISVWVLLVLVLSAVVATGSRMGVAGTFAGLLVAAALVLSKHPGRSRGVVGAIILSQAAAMVALFWVFGRTVLERAIFFAPDGITRADLYQQTLELISLRPLLGFGLDAYQLAFELVHRPPVSPDLVWGRAHSTYLALWTEMGVIAGSLPLLILAMIAWSMIAAVRGRRQDFVLPIAGIGTLVLGGLHSIVDFSLEMPANVYLFLAILALGHAPRGKRAE